MAVKCGPKLCSIYEKRSLNIYRRRYSIHCHHHTSANFLRKPVPNFNLQGVHLDRVDGPVSLRKCTWVCSNIVVARTLRSAARLSPNVVGSSPLSSLISVVHQVLNRQENLHHHRT